MELNWKRERVIEMEVVCYAILQYSNTPLLQYSITPRRVFDEHPC